MIWNDARYILLILALGIIFFHFLKYLNVLEVVHSKYDVYMYFYINPSELEIIQDLIFLKFNRITY